MIKIELVANRIDCLIKQGFKVTCSSDLSGDLGSHIKLD